MAEPTVVFCEICCAGTDMIALTGASSVAAGDSVTLAVTAVRAAAYADMDLVAWLSSVIDIYDELSGRTEHREITDQELTELALAVQR